MDTKPCAACGKPFRPRPQRPDQCFCAQPGCQRERRRRWQKAKLQADPDYRSNQARAQRAWAQRHPEYWRGYRAQHPWYCEANRAQALVRHPRQPLSRDKLAQLARGREFEPFDRSLDVQISRLRKMIEPDPAQPRYIQTVWGVGYVVVPDGAA